MVEETRDKFLRLRFSDNEVKALMALSKEAHAYGLITKPEVTKFIRFCINYYGAHYIQAKQVLAKREELARKQAEETMRLAEEARKMKTGPAAALIKNVEESDSILQELDSLDRYGDAQSDPIFGTQYEMS